MENHTEERLVREMKGILAEAYQLGKNDVWSEIYVKLQAPEWLLFSVMEGLKKASLAGCKILGHQAEIIAHKVFEDYTSFIKSELEAEENRRMEVEKF